MKKNKLSFLYIPLMAMYCFVSYPLVAANVNVRVVFPFGVSNVGLHMWGSYTNNYVMTQTGKNEFSVVVVPNAKIDTMIFYIDYYSTDYSAEKYYISGGNTYEKNNIDNKIPYRFDAKGVLYGKVYINNQLIDNSYTILNDIKNGLNISVKFNSDGSVTPYTDATHVHLLIDDRIPSEVHHRYAFRNLSVPTSDYKTIAGWVQSITDNNIIDSSRIDVDYLRLYGFIGKDSTLILPKEYNDNIFDPKNDGGLYLRYPFFPIGHDEHDPMSGKVTNGILTFYPSDNIRKVWHWWTGDFTSSDSFHYDNYKVICRLKIIGHALVQAGIDFKNGSNTKELGVSDWYFEKNGEWQDVVFDTRKITTTSPNAVISLEDKKTPVLSYNRKNNLVQLKYEDLAPGNYTLNIYNSIGQIIDEIPVIVLSSIGQSVYTIKEKISGTIIYCLKNDKDVSYQGKML